MTLMESGQLYQWMIFFSPYFHQPLANEAHFNEKPTFRQGACVEAASQLRFNETG
jgi:hypothetical protein